MNVNQKNVGCLLGFFHILHSKLLMVEIWLRKFRMILCYSRSGTLNYPICEIHITIKSRILTPLRLWSDILRSSHFLYTALCALHQYDFFF